MGIQSLPPKPEHAWHAGAQIPAPERPGPSRLPAYSTAELAPVFSQALDLGEGKPVGHAQRVCYIAMLIGRQLGLADGDLSNLFLAALMHDIGAPLAAKEVCRAAGVNEDQFFGKSPLRAPEELAFDLPLADIALVIDSFCDHSRSGLELAQLLEVPPPAADGIRCHHERWDGQGYPDGLAADAIPVIGRVVAAADLAEALITAEPNPLTARRNLGGGLAALGGSALDPALTAILRDLAREDGFWLGLYSTTLVRELIGMKPDTEERRSRKRLMRFAETFASLVDVRSGYPADNSRRVANWTHRLALALGLDNARADALRLAALVRDIGLLGVPSRVMAKPDILSIAEMQIMRQHPTYSRLILNSLIGLEDVAGWVACHHERPDGRGYPEMLAGENVPLEARIMAVADMFVALTSERAYRRALGDDDARQVLLGAAGSQLDPQVVEVFCTLF